MKICGKCELLQHSTEFVKNKNNRDGLSWNCKTCRAIYDKKYSVENKDKKNKRNRERRKSNPEKFKKYDLKKNFDITMEQYNDMYNKQNGYCAICFTHQSKLKKLLSVDHCHKTGKIRKLLCVQCNVGLGSFRDNPELCLNAYEYLKGNI